MNKYISFLFVVYALVASVYGGSCGYGQSAASGSVYNVNSYSLGSEGKAYPVPAPAPAPAYKPHYPAAPAAPKYSVQTLHAHELYPGRNNYKTYHSAPSYSQVVLPVIQSAPLAKIYIPEKKSYAAPAPAVSYGSSY